MVVGGADLARSIIAYPDLNLVVQCPDPSQRLLLLPNFGASDMLR
jgi:hypothetical protein